ncbi:hypothetical protein EDD22DRAFT_952955 [Suillus occidentalis]|nr:hypothetical protein EDD22DRAFT_952955 [Suillus occidentalis]
MSIVLVTLAVPMKNSEDVCQSLFDDGTKLRNDCKLDEDGHISDEKEIRLSNMEMLKSHRGSQSVNVLGRQGEKAAGLKGFLISKPLETLPRYAARPTSVPSRSSRSASPQPRFASSGSAI